MYMYPGPERITLAAALCRARAASGLPQATVAERAGVDQPMVSRYERGLRDPAWPTFIRLLRAAGAVPELRVEPLPVDGSMTLAEVGAHLRATGDEKRRRRLVLEFIGRFADAAVDRRRSLLLEPPPGTGDRRWDALLGALAEHLSFHEAVDPPDWCFEEHRFLEEAWFWIDLPSVRRRVLTGAPTAFRRRNVWVDRADLERR